MASTAFLQQAYLAYFGRPADPSGLAYYAERTEAEVKATFSASAESQAFFGSMSVAAQVNTIYQNLFNRDAEPAGLTYWVGEIGAGRLGLVDVAMAILNGAINDDKVAINNKIEASAAFTAALDTTAEILGYVGDASIAPARAFLAAVGPTEASLTAAVAGVNTAVANVVAAGTGASSAGQTFTLTTGVDNIVGTSGNDTFIADNTVSAVIQAADVIAGGAGTDTLKVFGNMDVLPLMSGVEVVIADVIADNKTVDVSSFADVTSVELTRAQGTAEVKVGNGVGVTVSNTTTSGDNITVTYAAAATSASLTLNKLSQANNDDLIIKGAALTTLNIATAGTATSIDELKTNTNTAITTINVTGDKDLTIADALEDEVTKVDATNFTGKLSIAGADIAQTIIGGSGNDTISLLAETTTKTMKVNLGAGDDTLKVVAANYTAADEFVGGDGADTLQLTIANGETFNTDVSSKTSGFEVLEVVTVSGGNRSATLNVGATKLGVTSLKATATTSSDTINFTGVQAASTITVAADVAVMSAALETATGTSDVLNIALGGTAGGIDVGTSFTANDIETINIASTGSTTKNTIASLVATAAKSVVVTGSGKGLDLTLTDVVAGTTTFNAADYSGALTLVATAEALKSVTTGSGDDTVTVGAGTLAQGFTAVGGAGTDKLVASATAGQNLGILAVSGFETVELTSASGGTDTVTADFRNVADLSTLKLTATDNGDVFVLNNFNGTATIAADNDTIGEINIQSTQTSASLKLGGAGNTTITTLTLDAGATTLNVESASDTSTITNLNGASLTTINVTGAGATSLDTTLGSTVTTIDASAATGAVTATLGGAGTLKGGSGNDVLGGTSGNDVIYGGAGNDVITAGSGVDIIYAGTGTDTIVIGAETGDGQSFTAPSGNSISTAKFDVVYDLGAGDILKFSGYSAGTAASAANGDLVATIGTSTTLAGLSVGANSVVFVRGVYDSAAATFVGSATGTDTLVVYDGNDAAATTALEAIVLVGFAGTGTAADTAGAPITLA